MDKGCPRVCQVPELQQALLLELWFVNGSQLHACVCVCTWMQHLRYGLEGHADNKLLTVTSLCLEMASSRAPMRAKAGLAPSGLCGVGLRDDAMYKTATYLKRT